MPGPDCYDPLPRKTSIRRHPGPVPAASGLERKSNGIWVENIGQSQEKESATGLFQPHTMWNLENLRAEDQIDRIRPNDDPDLCNGSVSL